MASTDVKYNASRGYIFQRGHWSGSARLTFQHHYLRDRYGFLIHPTIASALRIDDNDAQDPSTATDHEPLQILDFATGNGVWALDLASRLSCSKRTVQMTCLDVSKEQAPPPMIVPDNVSFGIHDVFDEVPERFLEKFDLVHVRLMQVALFKPGSGQAVARNLAKMLKRGGWMQWQETGTLTWSEVMSDGNGGLRVTGKSSPEMEVVKKYLGFGKTTEWLDRLDQVIAEQGGLVDTALLRPKLRKELLSHDTQVVQWGRSEAKEATSELFPDDEKREEYLKAFDEAERRIANGMLYLTNSLMAIGRKP